MVLSLVLIYNIENDGTEQSYIDTSFPNKNELYNYPN